MISCAARGRGSLLARLLPEVDIFDPPGEGFGFAYDVGD
jgi:hypothetical protein